MRAHPRVVEEEVRKRVQQVARHRDQAVVRVGLDRNQARAQRGHEAVHGAVAIRLDRAERREEPGRADEEIGGRAAGPARLGSADRVAANEPRVAHGCGADGTLRRPDIRDGVGVRCHIQHATDDSRQRRNGYCNQRDVCVH